MNVTLTLSPAVARWAAEQPTGIDALHAVLEEHVKAVESPYNQAWRALEARIPALPYDMSFSCRQMVGEDHWQFLDTGEKVRIGQEVSKVVDKLGLVAINKNEDGSTKSKDGRYKRKPV